MKSAVVVFPGSNCDRDLAVALREITGVAPVMVWHRDTELPPGPRPDRAARRVQLRRLSALGRDERAVAGDARGGRRRQRRPRRARRVQRLPGADRGGAAAGRADAQRGPRLRLPGRDADRRQRQTAFSAHYDAGETIRIPVAHHDGNYTADDATLDRLEGEGRVVFRYAEPVNGSARDIAGIVNDAGNVLGLMPHPERLIDDALGGSDGRRMFEGLVAALG